MAFSYKKCGPEFFEEYINNLKAPDKIIRPEPAEMAKLLCTVPFSSLDKQMTDEKHPGGQLLNSLMLALSNYYNFEGKDSYMIHEEEKRLFQCFQLKLENHKYNNKLNTQQMHRMLRLTYIEETNRAVIKEQKEDVRRRNKHYNVYNYKSDVDACLEKLTDCDSILRGSSDEYKEIERELKKLSSFLNDFDFYYNHKAESAVYASEMMKALAEKADQYVAERAVTEMNHSAGGYKGRRIAAMRKISSMLKISANGIETSLDGARPITELLDDEGKETVKKMLTDKMGEMTFSKRLFSTISFLNTKNSFSEKKLDEYTDFNKILVESMGKALDQHVVPFDKCKKASEAGAKAGENADKNIEAINKRCKTNEEAVKEYKKIEKTLRKDYINNRLGSKNLQYLDGMFDEKITPEYLKGDAYENIVSITCMQAHYNTEMKKQGIATKEPEPLYPGIEGDNPQIIERERKKLPNYVHDKSTKNRQDYEPDNSFDSGVGMGF